MAGDVLWQVMFCGTFCGVTFCGVMFCGVTFCRGDVLCQVTFCGVTFCRGTFILSLVTSNFYFYFLFLLFSVTIFPFSTSPLFIFHLSSDHWPPQTRAINPVRAMDDHMLQAGNPRPDPWRSGTFHPVAEGCQDLVSMVFLEVDVRAGEVKRPPPLPPEILPKRAHEPGRS